MKKGHVLFLAAILTLTSISAFAAGVPSKTAQDLTKLIDVKTTSGAVLEPDFVATIETSTEAVETSTEVLSEIAAFLENNVDSTPISYFSDEVQQEALALLPEGTDLASFQLNEFLPLTILNYSEEYGDVTVTFEFPTKYTDGQVIVAMAGIITGNDADGNPVIEWTPLQAEVVNGLVQIHYTQDFLMAVGQNEVVLSIFSEPTAG